jgi:hypothetical protein
LQADGDALLTGLGAARAALRVLVEQRNAVNVASVR